MFMSLAVLAIILKLIAASLTTSNPVPGPNLVHRDALPTFLASPLSDYFPSTFNVPSATDRNVEMYPTGTYPTYPTSGIEISFGNSLMLDLSSIARQSCKDTNVPACNQQLDAILKPACEKLNSRYYVMQPWNGTSLGLHLVLYEYLFMTWKKKHWITDADRSASLPHNIRLGTRDLEQLAGFGAAGLKVGELLVFQTAAGDADRRTATVAVGASSTVNAFPSASLLSADQDGHKQGDLAISVPTDTADHLSEFVKQMGLNSNCKAQAQAMLGLSSASGIEPAGDIDPLCKRGLTLGGEFLLGEVGAFNLIDLMNPVALLARLQWNGPVLAEMFGTLLGVAETLPLLLGLSGLALVAAVNIVIPAILLAASAPPPKSFEKITVPKENFKEKSPTEDDDDDKKVCRDGEYMGQRSPACDAEDCKAGADGRCTVGDNEHCKCVNWWVLSSFNQFTLKDFQEPAQAFDKWIADAKAQALSGMKAECDPKNNEIMGVELSTWKENMQSFCNFSDHPGKPQGQPPASKSFDFEFAFSRKAQTCDFTCEEIFDRFAATTLCRYDSHSMTSVGKVDMECGTASYRVRKLEPPPAPVPTKDTRYEIRVHQEMEYLNSFIEWDLWGIHNQAHISGPSRLNTVTGPTVQMHIDVLSPTKIEDTDVKFSYINGFAGTEMSTGSTGKNHLDQIPMQRVTDLGWPSYCRPLEGGGWRKKNAGYERDFKCYFNDVPCEKPVGECVAAFLQAGWSKEDLEWLTEVVKGVGIESVDQRDWME